MNTMLTPTRVITETFLISKMQLSLLGKIP